MKLHKVLVPLTALSLIAGLSAPAYAAHNEEGHGDRGNHFGWYKQDEQQEQQQYTVNFNDIGADFQWAQQAIQKLTGEGIFKGMDQDHFQPAGKLNRAQFAALISRYFGLQPATAGQQDFQDVNPGEWDFNVIEASKDYMTAFANLSGGYDFRPNQEINRAEAAVTLVELLKKQNVVQLVSADQATQILSTYSDANLIPPALRIHVATAIQAGVIKGVGANRFDPTSTLNRAQAATLLYRLQSQLEVPPTGVTTGITTGTSTEVAPGTTTTTTTQTTGSVTVGNPVSVNVGQQTSVYLIPTTVTAPTNLSTLESDVSSNLGSKTTVTQYNSTVQLSTTNLAPGTYTVYGVDVNGNVTVLANSIQIVAAQTTLTPVISSVVPEGSVTNPTTGNIQYTLNVNTSNVANNTLAVATLVNTNGTAISTPVSAQTSINNNTGTITLNIPANLPTGTYNVLVTVGSATNQSLSYTK